ncbi:hypothetical protein BU23DRAFT_267896 [Bimuria novae-zelandiae CBS 107.79]|uniref:Uncharacterized protein n=1 Tax=Bimuria novae-zelandiae CBS 107.79 TaxID=1447943 RepID=A0A6A5USI8_9PLEO|nr:hypothetical protein BU23DRAFT_267896 [Bimuria novae-zelandiae CBS 107.79]
MHFSSSTIVAAAVILGAADARPHLGHPGLSAAEDSGSANPFAGLLSELSSLLGAAPTGGSGFPGIGSGSGDSVFPSDGAAAPTGGFGLPSGGGDGFGSFPTATADIPSGVFPPEGTAVPAGGFELPTGGADEPGFELPTTTATDGFGSLPTEGADLPGLGSPSGTLTSDLGGIFPTGGVVPTGGSAEIPTSVTTAPASLPTETIDWSTFSFELVSTSAPFGGIGGGLGKNKK